MKSKITTGYLIIFLLSFYAGKAQEVSLVYTTANSSWVEVKKPVVKNNVSSTSATIHIYADSVLQNIEGFGGSFNEAGWVALKTLPDAEANNVINALFGKDGCNFSYCRMPIGASDYSLSYYSLNDVPEDFGMRDFNIDRDKFILMPFIKAAMKVKPDLKIWGSPWTPPAWMKVNEHYATRGGDWNGRDGGNRMDTGASIFNNATAFKMQERYLKAYALYFSKYIKAYTNEGVPITAIMPQNEIAYSPNWPSCTWRPEDMAYFIGGYLGPQLKKDGLNTEIWLGTINFAKPAYVSTILDDKKAAPFITGVGFQWGGSKSIPTISKNYPALKMMQTENICGEGENNWSSLQRSWKSVVHYMQSRAGSYMYWNMVLDETGMSSWGWPQNAMVVIDKKTKAVKYTDEFYLMKHLSNFIQPGDHLLKTSAGEEHLAFQLKDGRIVLLVNNPKATMETVNVMFGKSSVLIQLQPNSINTISIKQ